MPRNDRTYNGQDLIRIFKYHLDFEEQEEVRRFFATEEVFNFVDLELLEDVLEGRQELVWEVARLMDIVVMIEDEIVSFLRENLAKREEDFFKSAATIIREQFFPDDLVDALISLFGGGLKLSALSFEELLGVVFRVVRESGAFSQSLEELEQGLRRHSLNTGRLRALYEDMRTLAKDLEDAGRGQRTLL